LNTNISQTLPCEEQLAGLGASHILQCMHFVSSKLMIEAHINCTGRSYSHGKGQGSSLFDSLLPLKVYELSNLLPVRYNLWETNIVYSIFTQSLETTWVQIPCSWSWIILSLSPKLAYILYSSLTKKHPWKVHLKCPPKRNMGALLSFSATSPYRSCMVKCSALSPGVHLS